MTTTIDRNNDSQATRRAVAAKVREEFIEQRALHTLTMEEPDWLYGTISSVVTALFDALARNTQIPEAKLLELVPAAAQLTNNLHCERQRAVELGHAFFRDTLAPLLAILGEEEASQRLPRSCQVLPAIVELLDRTCSQLLDTHKLNPDDAIYLLRMGPSPVLFYMQTPNNTHARTHIGKMIAQYLVRLSAFAYRMQDPQRAAQLHELVLTSVTAYLTAMASVKITRTPLQVVNNSAQVA